MAFGQADGELVAHFLPENFNAETDQWPSAVGSITAMPMGTSTVEPLVGAFNGTDALDFPGGTYLQVSAAANPLAGATAFTLIAVVEPQVAGASGPLWHQSTGILGMEQAGSVGDWGMGLNGERFNGGAGSPDLNLLSSPFPLNQVYVVALTWNNSGTQRLFVNGVEVDSEVAASVLPRIAGPFSIGAITADGGNPFIGLIGELQVHNSDESANIPAISQALMDEYAVLSVRSFTSSLEGAVMVLSDADGEVDATGDFVIELDSVPLPSEAINVTKADGVTTITVSGALEAGRTYFYFADIPLVGGGYHDLTGSFTTQRLPEELPGPEGSVGSWGIREYRTTTELTPVATISTAVTFATATTDSALFVDGNAPVLNHSDPDTNGPRASGNFNNDFPILTNDAGDQNWVVVAKTKVSVPAAGVYTFAVTSDDGFAMRVSGAGGGRFIAAHGTGIVDSQDNQTIFLDGGSGDSNTRGVYQFDAAGEYDVMYLGYDGSGGGYHEVSWAPGTFTALKETNTWSLVGSPNDPGIPPFRPRYPEELAGPLGTATSFGVRTYLQATGLGNLQAVADFLATTERVPGPGDTLTVDGQIAYLSVSDPQANGGRGALTFPGNTPADDNDVISVVKGRITIPTSGFYTFFIESDDGAMLRIKGTGGNPDPKFSRVTGLGTFQMSNPNEMYLDDPTGNADTRGIIQLAAGTYDIEFIHQEIGGGFNYVVTAAAGEWPHGTTPPNGFNALGYKPVSETIAIPYMKSDWKVEASTPNRPGYAFNIGGARAAINATIADASAPAGKTSFWSSLNFTDPQAGNDGQHLPNNIWPLDTPVDDDNYAMRADGTLVITTPGEYHLGFQGDDGGYMYIDPLGGLPAPSWLGVAHSNHPNEVRIEELIPDSGVMNALVVELGTGNSRTLGRVNLQAGEYRIRTLMFEGGGGSWWEVIGAQGVVDNAATFVYPLLATGTAERQIILRPGLQLADPGSEVTPSAPLNITNLTVSGTTVGFNVSSTAGKTYTVEGSVNLVTWIPIQGSLAATGGNTAVSVDVSTVPQLNNQPKVFFRVREN